MLPVATPPNAIVFSSRQITIPQMATTGIVLNIIGSILITLFVIFYLPVTFL
jgi:sodium-dependent dicarboxylate transporter 2/3/5